MIDCFIQNISDICKERKVTRAILIMTLFIIVALSFWGEKVAKDNGIGWDGEYYLNTIQFFTDNLKSNSYDRYAIQRIMPYGLINIVFNVLGVYPGKVKSLCAAAFLSFIALVLSVFYFFKISNLLNWNRKSEIIAFSSFFYSYPILKVLGYCVLQSDIFGFLFGIMLLYYFLLGKKYTLVLLGIIGAFVWPTISLCSLVLAFFPNSIVCYNNLENKIDKFLYYTLIIIGSCSPLLLYSYSLYEIGSFIPMLPFRMSLPLTCPVNKFWIPLSCLSSCAYLYYMMRPFKISAVSFAKVMFGKTMWKNWACLIFVYCFMLFVLDSISNQNEGAVTMSSLPTSVALQSMTDPFVFVENHFWYFGPCYLLIVFLWNKVARYVLSYGAGYMFVVAMWVFLSLSPESRGGIMFIPFVLLVLIQYINTLNLRDWVPAAFAILSLIFSRFWFKINVVGMEYFLSWDNFYNYTEFPAQRYFMSTGRWQSHEMYYYIMTITILFMVILFLGKKYNFFVTVDDFDKK